jgi:signal transduction histidine kinase
MFVRDTGKGFNVDSIPADRHGIEISIRQRMRQHGGLAKIRSNPSTGTEVQLELPHHLSN